MAKQMVWGGVALAVAVRLALALMGAQVHLSRRVEVVTPMNSPMRLAEGHWLKKLGLSPYAGSAYHGSPLLLEVLGPLTNKGTGGQSKLQVLSSVLVFVGADLIAALLLRAIGSVVETAHHHYMTILQSDPQDLDSTRKGQEKRDENNVGAKLALGDVAAILYLLNPFTIAVCVGGTTSPFENMLVLMALYGALAGNVPLASFGWAISTHLSMYPAVLIIPIAFLTISGPDRPQRKVLDKKQLIDTESKSSNREGEQEEVQRSQVWCAPVRPYWVGIADLLFWSTSWWLCIMGLCQLALGGRAHLLEMLAETYGFMLTVEDLSPNLGIFWYFFTEVFTHFRFFFIMVFHANILFVILPLTMRLHHRPFFLAFVMVAIVSLLKSYPSVGDAALTLGLMALCSPQLSGFRVSLLIMYGYVFVAILSPSMYDLWIWRGTGNANFYFAMALAYSALQSILIVESVGTVIRMDRRLKISLEKKPVEEVDEKKQD
ncbi:unnamed protein product [Calypogeia fissa]